MALQDQIIKRLRDRGLEVVDLRAVLPRNGRWLGRPVSAIKQIAGHWDAEHRPHAYDSQARYIGQAWYHINKDWAPPGNVHGDGMMYAWCIDNTGVVFVTRDLEDVLWSVGDQNYVTASYKFDGTTGEGCTREMINTEQTLLDVLCSECPEFPATQSNVLGHQEVPGNSTSCPGDFLPSIRSYRAERNTHAELYTYDYQPGGSPAPTPSVPPAPPQPAPPSAPEPAPIVPPAPTPVPPPPPAGTIIQPVPGKGGGTGPQQIPNKPADSAPIETPSTGQTNAPSLPVKTPAVANPAPNPTTLPAKTLSFAFPKPEWAAAADEWEPFAEGEKVVVLEDAAEALYLASSSGLAKGPFPAGSAVRAIGYLTIAGKRYLVGKNGYGIHVVPEEPPTGILPTNFPTNHGQLHTVDATPEQTVSAVGVVIRILGRIGRALASLFAKSNPKEKE